VAVLRFQARWIEPISSGRKTQTLRRRLPGGVEVGALLDAGCRYDRPPFARLLIEDVDCVTADELDAVDVAREDVESLDVLLDALDELYRGAAVLVRVRFVVVAGSPVSELASSSSSGSPQ
jgi:uncharacterized protein YqfB (UPF0267 family)